MNRQLPPNPPQVRSPVDAPGLAIGEEEQSRPVLLCLLGPFRVLKNGSPIAVRVGGRAESLLSVLALRYRQRVPREVVLDEVWPERDRRLAGQSLNSLVHTLRRLLGDALSGAPPVLRLDGAYCLNADAGVEVDIARFDALADAGDRTLHDNPAEAVSYSRRAISLYGGDLMAGDTEHTLIERERLRARYLTLLARLASYDYAAGNLESCLQLALRLLEHDPCREDAHRFVMRCHVQLGERAQALRQFRLCEQILRREFDAEPEPATRTLFDQVRCDPANV